MRYTWSEIYEIMEDRRTGQGAIIKQMIEVRNRYNADWVLPSVSDEAMKQVPQLSPQIIADTVDNYGMRAGSVMPAISCPALNPSTQKGPGSRQYAAKREGCLQATWKHSRMPLILRKAYRHMAGYATSSIVVIPDFYAGVPRIMLRDPLATYPDPRSGEDFRDPENIGFVYSKSADWLRYNYPQTADRISRHNQGDDVMWNVAEWLDRDDCVIGLLGPSQEPLGQGFQNTLPITWNMELKRYPNKTGMVPAICPQRVTLDRIASQLANIIDITDLMAKLTALDILAKEKSIFPDRYIIGKNGITPKIVGGEWADGRTGRVNVLMDAEGIGSMNFASDPMATQAIDRLERNARVSAGLVPQMGGETYGALRTGRGIDALMGAAVDPRLQEMQETMQVWLSYLNEVVFETYKGYWPNKTFVMPAGYALARYEAEWVPSKHLETRANEVSYSIPGADVQGTTIVLGQLRGMGSISLKTFMDRHPFIGDSNNEKAMIDEENIEQAALQALLQAIQSGQASPMTLVYLEEARRKDPDGDIITAMGAAQRKMQEDQAKQAPEPQPGQVAAPETMPGIEGPPTQQPAEQIQAPQELGNLRELLNALGQTSGVVTR